MVTGGVGGEGSGRVMQFWISWEAAAHPSAGQVQLPMLPFHALLNCPLLPGQILVPIGNSIALIQMPVLLAVFALGQVGEQQGPGAPTAAGSSMHSLGGAN